MSPRAKKPKRRGVPKTKAAKSSPLEGFVINYVGAEDGRWNGEVSSVRFVGGEWVPCETSPESIAKLEQQRAQSITEERDRLAKMLGRVGRRGEA
jgi:hypothetical protein